MKYICSLTIVFSNAATNNSHMIRRFFSKCWLLSPCIAPMISSKVFELSNLHVLSYAVSVFFIPPVFSFTVDIFSTPLIIFFVVSSNILICNVQTVHPSNVVFHGLCGLHSSNFKSNHISSYFSLTLTSAYANHDPYPCSRHCSKEN